jgi:hypothetical protein
VRVSEPRGAAATSSPFPLSALACACALLALAASAARGTELHPHLGRLPGFPAARGVVPPLGSSAAVAARAKLVDGAFAAVASRASRRASGATERNEALLAPCEEEQLFLTTRDVCYRGGPVVRDPTVHLIFWQGPVEEDISKEEHVGLFPGHYVETVKRYFEGLAHDSGAQTNVFAVDPQYYDLNGLGETVAGEYALAFDGSSDVSFDETPFPKHTALECPDENEYVRGPCLLDSDLREAVERVTKTSEAGLRDVYLVLTPPGVDGCFGETGCAYKQYCAYHGDFGGDGVTPGQQTLYADLPFVGSDTPFTGAASGCDSEAHPNAAAGVDGVIDTASHELNEVITDPIGSQCKTGAKDASECEPNAWTDVVGQEIADKCLPPQTTVAGTYGEALGELIPGDRTSRFNQLIDGEHYFTQRVWSNEAGVFEGGCVQRAIGASFSVSPGAAASVPVSFDGSASGAPGDPAVYWVWSFEGEQVGTAKPSTSYVFSQPGQHVVTLTAYDAYGNAQATTETVDVGAAPVPPLPPPSTSAPALTVAGGERVASPKHLTSAQLAATLGLRASGTQLVASSGILLGHVACPPACAITAGLFAKLSTTSGAHKTRLVAIGSVRLRLAAKGTGALSLKLNARGRALLRKRHRLSCQLRMTVEGQEGGTWQITRSLTLIGGGRVAR